MSPALLEYPLVNDDEALQQVLEHMASADLLALDTEFVRERTYYPQLCLIQIATSELIAAIDCLAEINLGALFNVLANKDAAWLLHSARQDLEVLVPGTGGLPCRLIDTQIAAALAGFPLQVGLQGLLRDVLGIAIGKEHTRIDWSRRPLAKDAIAYALDDVRYLLPVWQELENRLGSSDRLTWFEEDCERQRQLPLAPDAASILERTRGAGALKGRQRAAARALVVWREQRAQHRDKPRRWILADDQLVRIASALPESISDLERVNGLPRSLVGRSGKAILDAIGRADTTEAIDREPLIPDRQLLKTLQDRIKATAIELGIPPEMLATRRDLAQAAGGRMPDSLVSGWRGKLLGQIIADVRPDPGS